MKKTILIVVGLILATTTIFGQEVPATNLNINAGNGHGIRFWGSDEYKIHMGVDQQYYQYGPVKDYSIKSNMYKSSTLQSRGWTWGTLNQKPIAALNTLGDMQIKGNFVSEGSLGVGIIAPTAMLHVNTLSSAAFKVTRGADTYGFEIGHLTFGLYDYTNLEYKWRVGNGNLLLVESSGRVGIGTASPSTQLNIKSSSAQVDATIRLESPFNSGQEWDIISSGGGNLINSGYFGIIDVDNNVPRLVIGNSGNVGIGTTAVLENYKLSVAGKLRAEEILVSLPSGWADYVFADDYELNTLSEVEEYIAENNHLPNVPSEKEVTEDGINLGEMDAILLRKIEELTLYIIEQDKRIKELESK